MNMKLGLLSLTMAGVAVLVVSCGSSTSDTSNNAGGSSTAGHGGKAGTSTAGTTNSSSGSSSGGKSSSGGSAASGGNTSSGGFSFGGFNFGGAGPDLGMFMCNPVPKTGAACAANTQPCLAGTQICYCQTEKWACIDLLGGAGGAGPTFGQLDCPEAKPMDGADCGDTVGFCPYGQNMGCACYNGAWACSP